MTFLSRSFVPEVIDRIDAKIAFRNGIGAAISWFAASIFSELLPHPNPIISSLWCVLTTLLVLQAHLGATYKAAWIRLLGLIIGTVLGALLATYFGADELTLAISIAGTIIICALLNLQEAYRIAISTVAVIMVLLPMNTDITPWQFSLYRFIDSCLGIIVAVFVAHVVFPFKTRYKLRLSLAEAMRDMGRLYRVVVSTTEPNDNQKRATLTLIKEIDTILYNNRETLEDSRAELITRSSQVQEWSLLLAQLDDLFERILAMRNTFRPNTKSLFDDQLNRHLEDVVEKISISFQDISDMLETGRWFTCLPDLGASLSQLKGELASFRGRSDSKSFNFDDIESFFVFFYSLKSIMELLKRVESTIHKLISEKTF